MFRLISCIAVQHSFSHLLFAATICVLGSVLAMRLFSRVRRTQGLRRLNWLFLSGFVGGSTIWTTPVVNGYDPTLTLISLVVGIVVTIAGFSVASASKRGLLVEAGGAIVGFGIALMHYIGIAGRR
jgi:diguanylate cyclase